MLTVFETEILLDCCVLFLGSMVLKIIKASLTWMHFKAWTAKH